MAVKMRLRRMGAKRAPFYRVVVADSRYPRDGRFIEEIGTYNPMKDPAEIKIDVEKAEQWLKNGAQPTDTVKVILKKSGVIEPAEDGRILRMEEKPAEPFAFWCAPPFYVYARQDLHFISEALDSGCGADAPGSFMAWLSAHTPVYAMEMPGKRYDIGNMASYEAVQREYEGITK